MTGTTNLWSLHHQVSNCQWIIPIFPTTSNHQTWVWLQLLFQSSILNMARTWSLPVDSWASQLGYRSMSHEETHDGCDDLSEAWLSASPGVSGPKVADQSTYGTICGSGYKGWRRQRMKTQNTQLHKKLVKFLGQKWGIYRPCSTI